MLKNEAITNYLSVKLELWETYHNHKEIMANAGFLVQLSLFGSVITETLWPPHWVIKIISIPEFVTFLVYFILWFLIHFYTRWQLINKRIGALYYTGYENAFRYFILHELTAEDLEECKDTTHNTSKIKDFFSKIVYLPSGYTKMDASPKNLPEFIAREIKDQFKKGSGAETLEIIVTYTSILLMILVGIKIFMS